MVRFSRTAAILAILLPGVAHSYDFDVQSTDSIKNTAKQLAADLMSMYTGNQPGQTPGLLPPPYYWWEAGALMGAMIDYWYYTGDTTYNKITQQGMLHQVGPYNDFMPPNQTLTEGNDDQGFWAMAAMSAAEYNFENPPRGQPQWLALAQAVFNTQVERWDTEHCNGGLRWQIFTWNNGFSYKNSISQACLFNIAARLALYTGNSTYADWAVKTWDWMVAVRFIDKHYRIYDGAHVESNCSIITPYEFSYNVGAFLHGSAAMVAYSSKYGKADQEVMWHERVDGLLNSTELIFFFGTNTSDRVMLEVACEPVNLCDVDQQSFKAYLSRWMAATTKWAPWTLGRIKALLRNSAVAAVRQCTGGANGRMCGMKWANNSGLWDGSTGVGQQMAVMEVVLANLIHEAKPPVTNSTGGTSPGDPGAGGNDPSSGRSGGGGGNDSGGNFGWTDSAGWHYEPITRWDNAGAAFVTFVILSALLTALVFVVADETKSTVENWGEFRHSLRLSSLSSTGGDVHEVKMGAGAAADGLVGCYPGVGTAAINVGELKGKNLIRNYHTPAHPTRSKYGSKDERNTYRGTEETMAASRSRGRGPPLRNKTRLEITQSSSNIGALPLANESKLRGSTLHTQVAKKGIP
ncbi:glycosyl hydrolase family 76-domain-containing protein [Xylariaceae sp. FL0594]|nr:glycosyl hydrolase family 76-domain-containing protein [Xylariaceae sp. FL0594]